MNIDMLFCIVLMVLGAFLIYYPIKDESPRQKLKKLADSVASDKKDIDYLIQRFSYLLDNYGGRQWERFGSEMPDCQIGGSCQGVERQTQGT